MYVEKNGKYYKVGKYKTPMIYNGRKYTVYYFRSNGKTFTFSRGDYRIYRTKPKMRKSPIRRSKRRSIKKMSRRKSTKRSKRRSSKRRLMKRSPKRRSVKSPKRRSVKRRSIKRKSCPQGKVKNPNSGRCVKYRGSTIRNLSKSSKRQRQVIPPLKKGSLGKYGYSAESSVQTRHAALKRAIKGISRNSVIRKLNAVAVLQKNKNPGVSKIFRADQQWISKNF
jgi:hypothetical protein